MTPGTRDYLMTPGETWPFVAPDATIVVEPISKGVVRARCLGTPEHFREDGDCAHIDRIRELNPDATVELLPRGGEDYEAERQIDLDYRRDRPGWLPEGS